MKWQPVLHHKHNTRRSWVNIRRVAATSPPMARHHGDIRTRSSRVKPSSHSIPQTFNNVSFLPVQSQVFRQRDSMGRDSDSVRALLFVAAVMPVFDSISVPILITIYRASLLQPPFCIPTDLNISSSRLPHIQRRPPVNRKLPLDIVDNKTDDQHKGSTPHHDTDEVPSHVGYLR